MCNWNQFFASRERLNWQWCINGQYTIFAERWSNWFWVDAFRQKEFSVVFSVYALCFRFLFVFGVNLWRLKYRTKVLISFPPVWLMMFIVARMKLTKSFWSTVLTTISSGAYWLTSKRNFNTLPSPSSCRSKQRARKKWKKQKKN